MDIVDHHESMEIDSTSAARNDKVDFPSPPRTGDNGRIGGGATEAPLTTDVLLRGILESTADGILAVDRNGQMIDSNRRFAEMWRIPKELLDEADDQAVLAWVLSQITDPEAFLAKLNALQGAATDDMDELTFKDGRIVKRFSSPLLRDGSVLGRIWSFHDVTQCRVAEKRLSEAEEQFRDLVEQTSTGILIVQDRKLAYVNPRVCEILGYAQQQELIGSNALSLVVPREHPAVRDMNRQLLDGKAHRIDHKLTALRKDGGTVAIGICSSRASYRGRPAIISMLQDISEKIRIEQDNRRYLEQLKAAFMSTVEVATIINEMRDPYTANHARRVADIAVAIGGEFGFDTGRQEGLHVAGHLHDIGKIKVPSEILSKPGKLTSLEFQLIQEHARAGFAVLKSVEFPWPVAQVALQHHERVDGNGYPQGLRGEEIMLEARIMAVADVFEAMASHRPYRAAMGIEKALAEIERGRGTKFDTNAADACLSLMRELRYQLPV